MENNNLIRFVQSLMLLPVMAVSLSIPNVQSIETSNVSVKKVNIEAGGAVAINKAIVSKVDSLLSSKEQTLKAEADAIDAYFNKYDMPLVGTGMKMAKEADENGIDWRLLPAIAVRESTGGKNACDKVKNNPFGWASCKVGFDSIDQAIETIATNLGGNNPNTAKHYDNKTIKGILHAYNPPSVVPRYAEQVIAIMDAIGNADLTVVPAATNNS
jgi:hypothetical protein